MKDAEIAQLKTQIAHLESKVASLENANKRTRIEFEKEMANKLSETRVCVHTVYPCG